MTKNPIPTETTLPRLAAKQKRLQDLVHWAAHELQDDALKPMFEALLQKYRGVLRACWETQSITDQHAEIISTVERELQEIDNESRTRVTGQTSPASRA